VHREAFTSFSKYLLIASQFEKERRLGPFLKEFVHGKTDRSGLTISMEE
jgi:hypothetical protein